MNNKTLGNIFERDMAKALADRGFWVHQLRQNDAGQPADLIAVRNGQAYLIDCKVCTSQGFRLTRIEPNQDAAMSFWVKKGNNDCWFALLWNGNVRMLSYDLASRLKKIHQASIKSSEMEKCTIDLERWLEIS